MHGELGGRYRDTTVVSPRLQRGLLKAWHVGKLVGKEVQSRTLDSELRAADALARGARGVCLFSEECWAGFLLSPPHVCEAPPNRARVKAKPKRLAHPSPDRARRQWAVFHALRGDNRTTT